jgi:hypothetical protein
VHVAGAKSCPLAYSVRLHGKRTLAGTPTATVNGGW